MHVFRIILGILLGRSVLLLARFFKHMSYVVLSKYSCSGALGFPFLSMTKPSKSCHGYCLTPYVHFGVLYNTQGLHTMERED